MRLLPLLALLLLAAGCATATSTPAPAATVGKPTVADHRLVAELRGQARSLLQGQAELFWQAWTAGERVDVGALYEAHELRFTANRLQALRRVRHAEKEPGARRALTFLEGWYAGELLARSTADLATERAKVEAEATFLFDGKTYPWRQLEPMLAAEADPARRQQLQEAALPVLDRLQELTARERARLEEAARELGYQSALHAAAALRQIRPAEARELAGQVLAATDDLYGRAFSTLARRQLGSELAQLRRADVPRLFAGVEVLTRFPEANAAQTFETTVAALGLRHDAIRIEPQATGGRPLAFAVDPPSDVRLALPAASWDWAPIFHEGGAALHAAHVEPATFEVTLLGNQATAEAFAVLFENLTTEPAWLVEHTGMTGAEAAAHAGAAAARRLYLARRHAARLDFQIARATGAGDRKPEALYQEAMARAYGFDLGAADAAWYVVDQDRWLFGADTLRAWILAAMLEEHLVEQHGATWWTSPEAGRLLQGLAAPGNRDDPTELAQRLGADALDPSALVRQLEGKLERLLPAPRS